MKLKNVFSIPFSLIADVITLGNLGDESFTEKVFRNDREERQTEELLKLMKILSEGKDNGTSN